MSKIALSGNASGTGTLTIASQNTNSNYTLTIPNETGTLTTTASTPTFTGAVTAPSFIPNGSSAPTNGVYLPAANAVGIATNSTNAIYIDSSQNVGIGTSSPSYKLDVSGTARFTNSINQTAAVDNYIYEGSVLYWTSTGTSGGTTRVGIKADSSNNLVFYNGSGVTERMRIDSSGYVLVGATSSVGAGDKRFEVQAGSSQTAYLLNYTPSYSYSGIYNASDSNTYNFWKSGNNYLFGTVTNPDTSGWTERARINSNGNLLVGTSTAGAGAGYETRLAVDGGSTYDPCMIKWSGAATSAYVLRLWNTATSGDNLFAVFQTEGTPTDRGNIRYNRGSGVVAYNTSSDANLKNIIGDSDGQRSLEILNTTRIREFAWKDDPNQYKQIGVIAQELYETYPGAVTVGGDFEREREVTEEVEEEYTDEEGNTQTRTVTKVVGTEKFTQYRPWSVDKTAFQLHLVAGWQAHEKLLKEAMTRIETLEAEVAALKGTN